jgi:DNA-binding NarL/FixJ family response regulator
VEDSPIIRDMEVSGYADTESGAIAALERDPCDAVVLDLQLRQGNGLNVIKALRSKFPRSRTTFVVLTNYAFPQYRARSLQLGADYFFDKARDYDRVREVLERIAAGDPLPSGK